MTQKGWKEIPIGGKITDAGNAAEYKTGDWKTFRPEVDRESCIKCLFCWIYCPDMSVKVVIEKDDKGEEKAKRADFDFDYCKGCGICALECPGKKGNKAIVMEEEGK